jgi:hypothetical protein
MSAVSAGPADRSERSPICNSQLHVRPVLDRMLWTEGTIIKSFAADNRETISPHRAANQKKMRCFSLFFWSVKGSQEAII